MGWNIRDFYTKKSEWFGPAGIFPEHRERASLVGRLCGRGRKRILELGAGSGGTAAAMADHGHAVVAVEFSPLRVAFARELAAARRNFKILEADFYTVKLSGRFDVVCFWDSFGMGSDADQRRLLRRVGREWLARDGFMLLDVFSPWAWASRAGKVERVSRVWRLTKGKVRTVNLEIPVMHRYEFDHAGSRFIDEWWPVKKRKEAIRQIIRCYTPADFLLLLRGTDLRADLFEVDGERFDVHTSNLTMKGPLAGAERYLVRLSYDARHERLVER